MSPAAVPNYLEDFKEEKKNKVVTMDFKHFDPTREGRGFEICQFDSIPKNSIIRYNKTWRRKVSDYHAVEKWGWQGLWQEIKKDRFVLWVTDKKSADLIELNEEIPMY